MARIRTIKPEFPQSESMGRVSRDARLLFVMLWTICDDHGRTRAHSRMLASLLFPYDEDAGEGVKKWLEELEDEGCIRLYEVSGSQYLEVCNWKTHQRIDKPSKPQFPGVSDEAPEHSRVSRERSSEEGKGKEGKGREQGISSSLRSEDLSAPLALTPDPPPPADLKASRTARIRQIAEEAQEAYNRILAKPNGLLTACTVLNAPRLRSVEKSLPTARAICKALYGSERITAEFWQAYFETADTDDFHAGRKSGGPGHENWLPDFEFLLRESVMAKLFDRAMTEQAA